MLRRTILICLPLGLIGLLGAYLYARGYLDGYEAHRLLEAPIATKDHPDSLVITYPTRWRQGPGPNDTAKVPLPPMDTLKWQR